MIIFDLGDCRPIKLDAESREPTRQSILRKLGLMRITRFGNLSSDNVLFPATVGHTKSLPFRLDKSVP